MYLFKAEEEFWARLKREKDSIEEANRSLGDDEIVRSNGMCLLRRGYFFSVCFAYYFILNYIYLDNVLDSFRFSLSSS
jgi:hypothetical protein